MRKISRRALHDKGKASSRLDQAGWRTKQQRTHRASNPSQDDINTTKEFTSVLSGLGIMVMDHIVIGKNSYSSLKEMGVFPNEATVKESKSQYLAAKCMIEHRSASELKTVNSSRSR